MTKKQVVVPQWWRPWVEARRRHRLSHAHIQMARELGMNPKKFGKIDNHRQEPWKAPLPIFIETLYFKRFGKDRPDKIRTIEEMIAAQAAKKQARKLAKQARKAPRASGVVEEPLPVPTPHQLGSASDRTDGAVAAFRPTSGPTSTMSGEP